MPDQAQAGVRAKLAQLEAQMDSEQGWVRGGTKAEARTPLSSVANLPGVHCTS